MADRLDLEPQIRDTLLRVDTAVLSSQLLKRSLRKETVAALNSPEAKERYKKAGFGTLPLAGASSRRSQ